MNYVMWNCPSNKFLCVKREISFRKTRHARYNYCYAWAKEKEKEEKEVKFNNLCIKCWILFSFFFEMAPFHFKTVSFAVIFVVYHCMLGCCCIIQQDRSNSAFLSYIFFGGKSFWVRKNIDPTLFCFTSLYEYFFISLRATV